jgi:hypothetical protein
MSVCAACKIYANHNMKYLTKKIGPRGPIGSLLCQGTLTRIRSPFRMLCAADADFSFLTNVTSLRNFRQHNDQSSLP